MDKGLRPCPAPCYKPFPVFFHVLPVETALCKGPQWLVKQQSSLSIKYKPWNKYKPCIFLYINTEGMISCCKTFSDQRVHHIYHCIHDYLAFSSPKKGWFLLPSVPWNGVGLSQGLTNLGFRETVPLAGKSHKNIVSGIPKPQAGQVPLQCHKPVPVASNQAGIFPPWGHVQHAGSFLSIAHVQLVLFFSVYFYSSKFDFALKAAWLQRIPCRYGYADTQG